MFRMKCDVPVTSPAFVTAFVSVSGRPVERGGRSDAQVLEDAERLIAAWNERQAKRMPMLFSPTTDAANNNAPD